jgi:HSP20 family protein
MVTAKQSTKAANGTEVLEREQTRRGPWFRPDIDIYETTDELVVLADVPGASGESVDIRFENGLLTVNARIEQRQGEETDYAIQEYAVGDYSRTFQVSEDIDPSRITAELADGLLTVHLPKAEAAKPRKIQVQSK